MSTQIHLPESKPVGILPADPSSHPQEAQKQRIERQKTYGGLLEYIKNTCKKVEEEDSGPRLDILKQQNKCQAYYDDRQYGKLDDRTGEWKDSPPDDAEFRPVDNRYKEQVDKLQMEMARSTIDLLCGPTDTVDSAMQEAAEFAKSRIEANRKRLFIQRPEFVLAENMSLLLKTITYRYHYFDANAEDGPREKRPNFQKKVIGEDKSLTVCAVCKAPREVENKPAVNDEPELIEPGQPNEELPPTRPPCPQCGSISTKLLSTSAVELELPAGEEEVSSGLPRCVHADPTMVQVSMNARNMDIRTTPYLIWTQMVERGKLEKMFPDRVIPSSDSTDDASRYRRENEGVSNAGGLTNTETEKGGEQFEKLKFKLVWLDSWVYGDYVSQKPEKLPDGQELPAGTKLITLFPEGMCVAKVGDTPLALYSENKNKKWSVCVYGLRESAWHGSGTNALLPIQLTINNLLGFRLANVYYNTFRREFIKQGAIQGDTLPNIDQVCVVTNLDEGQGIIGGAYAQAPPTPLPAEVPQLSQEQTGALQEQAGTSSLSLAGTSAQSQALGTATGIAAMRDLAVGRMGPNLMLKAAMEVESAYQILELEQKHYSKQQLLAFAGIKPGAQGNLGYTQRGVEAFLNCDIRASFNITPAPGSWMPETDQQRKADAIAFADAAGKVQDPEVIANLAKVFKQPMTVGGFNATQREAARRIEEFGKIVSLLESKGFSEPTDQMAMVVLQSASEAQVSVELDDHAAFINFHRDWHVSDEARNASPLLRKVVEVRNREHKEAMVQSAQTEKTNTLRTQLPDMAAQQMMEQSQARQQMQLQGEAAEQQMMLQQQQMGVEMEQQAGQMALEQENAAAELEKKAVENELSAADREHALEAKMVDREHQAMTSA